MNLECGALLPSSWGLKSHLARRSPPLIAEHRPTLYVKHGGGFGAAAPLFKVFDMFGIVAQEGALGPWGIDASGREAPGDLFSARIVVNLIRTDHISHPEVFPTFP